LIKEAGTDAARLDDLRSAARIQSLRAMRFGTMMSMKT
jgi:hypothetical protein